jgi:hypothetical protein
MPLAYAQHDAIRLGPFAARKIAQIGTKQSPALQAAIYDAISVAENTLRQIDRKWPT